MRHTKQFVAVQRGGPFDGTGVAMAEFASRDEAIRWAEARRPSYVYNLWGAHKGPMPADVDWQTEAWFAGLVAS